MRTLLPLVFLIGFTLLVIGCKIEDIDPNTDFTGHYRVYTNGLSSFGIKSTTTNQSTQLEIKKGRTDKELILSHGSTNLTLAVSGTRFKIPPQGVYITVADGSVYLAGIIGEGVFSVNKITYSYMITYNNIDYEPNGYFMVVAKK